MAEMNFTPSGSVSVMVNLNEVPCQRQGRHQAVFLLVIQSSQHAVVLLGDTGRLEDIGLQFLLRPSGIHDEKGDQEHALVFFCSSILERSSSVIVCLTVLIASVWSTDWMCMVMISLDSMSRKSFKSWSERSDAVIAR